MDTTAADNRNTNRMPPSQSSVLLHGLREGPVPAAVIDESFGGIGVAAPVKLNEGIGIGIELTVQMDTVQSSAIVRHVVELPSGCRLGLEWKAQALSRCLRNLLVAKKTAHRYQPLVRILPGGLSLMWKLLEAGRWQHLVDGSDRLRKEAAACGVTEMSGPIDRFQKAIREAIDIRSGDVAAIAETELNSLIDRCVDTIRR